ncbi:MAG: protein kinase [bacterium]
MDTDTDLKGLLGSTLAGRFELRSLLGQGGYGAVFEAEQTSMGRRCAVKVLAPRDGVDRKTTARFEMEARATSKLSHPNTITIYDFGEDETLGVFFIAMEYVEGTDLASILKDGPMPVHDVLHVLKQAAGSLDDAHLQGIIHRDVKPQNMMVCPRPNDPLALKVIDFGIAKAMGKAGLAPVTELTITGTIVGTPQYMSPEQVRDVALDGRSDQYSLAVCAYTMLTGRPPFFGTSPIDIATKHLTDQPLPISVVQPDLNISPSFDDALLKALAKQPDDRYPTCTDFVDALSRALSANPVAPVRKAPAEPAALEPTTESLMAEVVTEPQAAQTVTATAALRPMPEAPDTDEPGHTVAVVAPAASAPHPGTLALVREPTEHTRRAGRLWWGGLALVTVCALALGWWLTRDAQPQDARSNASSAVDEAGGAQTTNTAVEATPVEQAPDEDKPTMVAVTNGSPNVAPSVESAPTPEPAPDAEPELNADAKPDRKPKPKPTSGPSQTVSVEPKVEERRMVDVQVTMRPWGTLYIDGKSNGEVPRQTISLTEGRHTFELRQDGQSKVRRVVEVSPSFKTVHLVVGE